MESKSPEEMISAADALRKQVESAAASIVSSLHHTSAEAPPPTSSGAIRTINREIEEKMAAARREIDIASWMANSRVHMAQANLYLATAMQGHLNKAALASADVLEFAAVTWRETSARLDLALSEGDVHQIKEAIKYARSCRTAVGFL